MGKVVRFQDLKRKNNSKLLNYEELDEYIGLLEIKLCLMDELFLETESMLREYKMDLGQFELDKSYAERMLNADMIEFKDGGEETLELSYSATINGETYRTFASASCYNDIVKFDCMLMKWDGQEWLVRSGEEWGRGPGSDFFG